MAYPIWSSRIDQVAAGVRRVAARHADLPVDLVVLSRLIIGLGRDLTAGNDEMIRPHGLSEGDLRVLMILYGRSDGAANAGDLGDTTGNSPANITRIADHLLELGLITRKPGVEDRRCVLLAITRRGETLVRGLLPRFAERMRSTLGVLSQAQVRRLTADLRRVADALVATAQSAQDAHAAQGAHAGKAVAS